MIFDTAHAHCYFFWWQMCLLKSAIVHMYSKMINFDAVDFNDCRAEEGEICLF